MKQYYVQRASAGLVITEFTSIDNDAITFHREPCIADDAQTAKWKEIVDAVHAAGGRIFCQIAHGGRAAHPSYQDMHRGETAPDEVKFIASIANDFGLAYLHVMRADFFGQQKGDVLTPARETLKGPALVVNMGFEVDEAKEGVAAGRFDAVAFGTKFLANPDLPARIAAGAALNDPKADLFYTGKVGDLTYTGPEGYTDYPTLP